MPRLTNRRNINNNRLIKRQQSRAQRTSQLKRNIAVPIWQCVSALLFRDGSDVAGCFGEGHVFGDVGVDSCHFCDSDVEGEILG